MGIARRSTRLGEKEARQSSPTPSATSECRSRAEEEIHLRPPRRYDSTALGGGARAGSRRWRHAVQACPVGRM
eukprot:1536423-Pyramimonas_sp.AAC.1